MGAKTAKQQDALTELLDLLTQNGRKQEAAELSALFSQFAAMETQYGKVLSELAAVREQLATLHDRGNRAAAMQETLTMFSTTQAFPQPLACIRCPSVMKCGNVRKRPLRSAAKHSRQPRKRKPFITQSMRELPAVQMT